VDENVGKDLKTKQCIGEAGSCNWYEVRPMGRIPERRAYHASCTGQNKVYVYGGSDIREGLLGTMWVLPLNFLSN